jgi:hypothetical protein
MPTRHPRISVTKDPVLGVLHDDAHSDRPVGVLAFERRRIAPAGSLG